MTEPTSDVKVKIRAETNSHCRASAYRGEDEHVQQCFREIEMLGYD